MNVEEIELLLIEDNHDDVELMLRALRQHRLANEVHVVRDGEEALAILFGDEDGVGRRYRPRLILLDLKLPKVDGLEVLRRIKDDVRTQTIPTVVLTSSQEERDVVRSYELGVNSYIVKPVEFDKLVDAVREVGLYWLILNTPPR